MEGQLYTLTTRHEQKMAAMVAPGSPEDQRLSLSYKGQQNAHNTGQNQAIVPPNFDVVIADRSTLVRTTQTLQHMLAGAGYNPDDANVVVWNPEDAGIGLANGMDFAHTELPLYAPTPTEARAYIERFLTKFWLPITSATVKEKRPVAAIMAYTLLNNTIR